MYTQDFPPENADLVTALADVLNINLQVVYDALNKKVSLTDNIDCIFKDVSVVVGANGVPLSSTIFTLDDKTRNLQGLEVVRATNTTNSAVYPTGGIFITWQQVQTGVQIQHVTGLPANNKFTLRVIGYY
tara:strand:+ start:4532 stop:4921 length:390 start_codon:yes stop_codon:yes gene_type:complete